MTAELHSLTPRTTPGIRTRRAIHGSSARGHNSTETANSGPRDFSTQGQQTVSGQSHKLAQVGSIPTPASTMSGVAGREPASAPASPGASSIDRPIRSAHQYRGDETMQMLVIAFAIAVASVTMLVWALWPAK